MPWTAAKGTLWENEKPPHELPASKARFVVQNLSRPSKETAPVINEQWAAPRHPKPFQQFLPSTCLTLAWGKWCRQHTGKSHFWQFCRHLLIFMLHTTETLYSQPRSQESQSRVSNSAKKSNLKLQSAQSLSVAASRMQSLHQLR